MGMWSGGEGGALGDSYGWVVFSLAVGENAEEIRRKKGLC